MPGSSRFHRTPESRLPIVRGKLVAVAASGFVGFLLAPAGMELPAVCLAATATAIALTGARWQEGVPPFMRKA